MTETLLFKLPEGADGPAFQERLAGREAVGVASRWRTTGKILDTFDWRLYEKRYWAYCSTGELVLRDFDGQIVGRLQTTDCPVFAWDLPASDLQQTIADLIEMRALLPLAAFKMDSTRLRLLNANEKTVAWITFQEVQLEPDGPHPVQAVYGALTPVRGYRSPTRKLAAWFKEAGASPVPPADLYDTSLKAAGRTPGDYSSKLNFMLDPEMRSDEAARIILRFLAGVIRANEAGIKADIDTEFLHDFRVALRRTRSALTQIKGVFPAGVVTPFKEDFGSLGQRTNELRDLDVYLLSEPTYKSMLPPALQENIEPLFDLLRSRRAAALQQVIEGFHSPDYARIMDDWENFLSSPLPDNPEAPNALLPVLKLAQRRIAKRYRSIVQDGTAILENTHDEQLHALRIECKKLRYLMEFFASLFPEAEITYLIKQLKMLQDNLGNFNDLTVQQETLLALAHQLPPGQNDGHRTLVAIGSLVEALNREQQTVKAAFAGTFQEFASPANQELAAALFKARGRKQRS